MEVSKKIYDICQFLEDKKATDITVCNATMLKKSVDFYILATATSVAHAKALADYIIEKAIKLNLAQAYNKEGLVTSDWVVVDLEDCFIHIYTKETRERYNLEKLLNEGNNLKRFDKIKKDKQKEEKQLHKKNIKDQPKEVKTLKIATLKNKETKKINKKYKK